MSVAEYLDLQRKFVERGTFEPDAHADGDIAGKHIGWNGVLSRRASVIRAPANYGKTTELLEQASRLREKGQIAVFVPLRRVRSRGGLEAALLDSPDDGASFKEWLANPTTGLTVFLDSLDEASPRENEDLTFWLGQVTTAVNWPATDVRWVISTRPALLTPKVLEQLRRLFSRGKKVAPTKPAAGQESPAQSALDAVFNERVVDPEMLAVFSMTELERGQSVRYLEQRLKVARAPEVLALASRRGLGSLASNPGGLAMLADIDLLSRPPESLTEIFERLEAGVWRRLGEDRRIQDAGNEGMAAVSRTVRRLAAASQLCQLPNIELPQDGLLLSNDAVSARLIAGGQISEAVLRALMGSHGFIDVDHHQVKMFPDELPPYMAARHVSALVKSPEMAHGLVAALSWEAPSGERGVDKRLLPLMGWLATLNPHCRAEILNIDPHALAFFGDLRNPTVPQTDAERALREAIAGMVERNDWPGRGQFRLTSENYWQAGPIRLEAVLKDLFRKHAAHEGARDVLLDVAAYSGSKVLRDPVMKAHDWDYAKLLMTSIDVYYILELGRDDDLKALATALLASPDASESLAARLTEKLGWQYLNPRDVVSILQRHFARGHGGYHLTLDVKQALIPAASNEQLFNLARGLVLKASSSRERQDGRTPRLHLANERFLEFSAEVLSTLMLRDHAASADALAVLCLLLFRVVRDAYHGTADLDELKEALKERTQVRRAYFRHLVRWAASKEEDLWHFVFGYGSLCVPRPEDVEALRIDALTQVVREEQARLEKAASHEHRKPERKDRFDLSAEAKKDLLASVARIRDGSALNVIAWVANWLMQTNKNSRYGEVDFGEFEKRAGKELANAVRDGFARLWRKQPPMFREDEPNSTYHITAAGLQGLHLELGDGKKLPNLSADEVKQAVRYAAFEINGFPDWFWALARAHEDVAGEQLEKVAKAAGAGAVSRGHAENLFSALDEAPQQIRERLAPLAWQVLKNESSDSRDYVVDRMLQATKALPEVTSQTEFEALAWQRLSEPFSGSPHNSGEQAQSRQNATGQATVWGSHWLTQYPRRFVERMQRWVHEDSSAANDFLFALASELGKERGALLRNIATQTTDGVDALGALYVLMLNVVNWNEDTQHPAGEVYSIGRRDSAQDLRDSIVPLIAEARTQRAYDVLQWLKLKLNRDRTAYFNRVQYQMREAQFAPAPMDQRDFDRFEREFRAGVTNSVSFNLAVQSALLAVKYDIEQGEHSLRRFFSAIDFQAIKTDKAGLALESDFQQLLASELKHQAHNQFVVQRESETAEHNRRDVHCTKEALDLTVSIELKMSERWTVAQYVEALEDQLVGQYMRHRNAKTGFLVIVLQRVRKWEDPDTGGNLSFDALLTTLQERADALMRNDSAIFLRVIGINAVEPQSFRRVSANRRVARARASGVASLPRSTGNKTPQHGAPRSPRK